MDHHYLFPERGGDVLAATIEAAADVGLRFHPTRGSMDLGQSSGGLPPDDVVEEIDAILAATQAAIERFHDPSPGSMLRVGVAPCSPFSVSRELLTESAALARSYPPGSGVRLHTHLAETADENDYCLERFGCTPAEYVDSIGWLGPDVWLAHGVHLDDQAICQDRRDRHRRRALPVLQRQARRGHLPHPLAARRGRAGRARRGRRRLQRGQLAGRRSQRGGAVRPGGRRRAAR